MDGRRTGGEAVVCCDHPDGGGWWLGPGRRPGDGKRVPAHPACSPGAQVGLLVHVTSQAATPGPCMLEIELTTWSTWTGQELQPVKYIPKARLSSWDFEPLPKFQSLRAVKIISQDPTSHTGVGRGFSCRISPTSPCLVVEVYFLSGFPDWLHSINLFSILFSYVYLTAGSSQQAFYFT